MLGFLMGAGLNMFNCCWRNRSNISYVEAVAGIHVLGFFMGVG